MLDPIVSPVMIILGQYVVDKGVELGKAFGPRALATAKALFQLTLECLRRTPKGAVVADGYVEDPDTYVRPVEKELNQAVQADETLKARLQALLAQFEEQAEGHVPAGVTNYNATVTGGGASAQGKGATAVGQGGVIVSGSSSGPIITGSGVTINYGGTGSGSTPAGAPRRRPYVQAPRDLLEKMDAYLDREDVRTLCFNLEIDYDNLGGEGKVGKLRELILRCEREHRVPDLLAACRESRPHAPWPSV